MRRWLEICLDANDPDRIRPFWAAALGYEAIRTDEGALDLADPAGAGPILWFQQVSEKKTHKNRMHVDVWVDQADADSLRDRLLELGGSVVAEHPEFTVLADPEGNELCVCWRAEDPPTAT